MAPVALVESPLVGEPPSCTAAIRVRVRVRDRGRGRVILGLGGEPLSCRAARVRACPRVAGVA